MKKKLDFSEKLKKKVCCIKFESQVEINVICYSQCLISITHLLLITPSLLPRHGTWCQVCTLGPKYWASGYRIESRVHMIPSAGEFHYSVPARLARIWVT